MRQQEKPVRFCLYSRKSKATLKGDSVGNQIEMGMRYIRDRYPDASPEDIDIFEDDGFSGKNTKRPGFTRMMAGVTRGDYAYLIVYRLDRISRSVGDFADILKVLERTHTQFISLSENFDTSSVMGRAMMSIASVFAQMERETISERVTDNMLLLSHTGRWLGGRTPAGFKAVRVDADPARGIAKAYSMLAEDAAEMNAVCRAITLYRRLGAIRATTQALFQENVRINGQRQLSDFALKSLLTNPVYCVADQDAYDYFYQLGCAMPRERADFNGTFGCMPYNRHNVKPGSRALRAPEEWVIAVGSHRGVISGRDFAALQRRLAQNALLHPREQAARNSYALLTGLLVCGRCGAKMYTQPQSDGHGGRRASGAFLYVCERRKRFGKDACDCPSVSGLQLDAAVREALAAYRSDDTAFGARLAGLRDVQGRRHTADSELAAVQAAVAEAEKKLHTLLNRLADPELPEEALRYIRAQSREMAERIATDRERIEQLKAAEAQSDRVEQGYRQICTLLDCFSADYGSLSIPEQRDVLRGVIDRVEWNGESAQIFPIQP